MHLKNEERKFPHTTREQQHMNMKICTPKLSRNTYRGAQVVRQFATAIIRLGFAFRSKIEFPAVEDIAGK